ncbi:MAG TPA: divergent polysaccharide deacetylase family protein [Pseudolabrys sp.]|nr:divergent polysaccharide deacetylase family protein [Pseudolabrys sp.]
MPADDLNAPLGQDKRKRPSKLPAVGPQLVAGALGLAGIAAVTWAVAVKDPLGGEPIAVVPAGPLAKTAEKPPVEGQKQAQHSESASAAAPAVKVVIPPPAPPPGSKTITIIDGSSGKHQDVVLPGKADEAAQKPAGDRTNVEATRHGAIPKAAADGARPLRAFAHPRQLPPDKANAPRIAIIVGGLGISTTGTADALSKLPAPVTLAIAPYGNSLDKLVERASTAKHEVLLQSPMEPFDYPDNDPGPETLLTSLTAAQNIDRLHWQMSRMQGYVGIVSYMGARFTSSEPSLAPVLRETAKRGLIYVDDGASSRSIAGQLAASQNFPFARTDVVIDTVPTPVEIDRALARLELVAREHGSAVGLATALPATITRIAEWAKSVEARGFVLVPITMVAMKEKSS